MWDHRIILFKASNNFNIRNAQEKQPTCILYDDDIHAIKVIWNILDLKQLNNIIKKSLGIISILKSH